MIFIDYPKNLGGCIIIFYKFDIKYKIYTMKPSDIYADKMFRWRASQDQLKLMIEDKCTYDFVLTKPN